MISLPIDALERIVDGGVYPARRPHWWTFTIDTFSILYQIQNTLRDGLRQPLRAQLFCEN